MKALPEPLGIIGGSGLYQLKEMSKTKSSQVKTPYGHTDMQSGQWHGHDVFFITRHGVGHSLAPHQINYKANIWALHEAGAQAVLSINCAGGIHPGLTQPGIFCAPDQLLDFTQARQSTFFDEGSVSHIDMTDPFDPSLRQGLIDAGHEFELFSSPCCYAATQGPRLETRAEINFLEKAGADLVGMTAMPEVALVREKGLPAVMLSLVLNAAAGRGEGVIREADFKDTLAEGMQQAQLLIGRLLQTAKN